MDYPRIIAFDTETHLFGPGKMAPRIVCLSWSDGKHSGIEVGDAKIELWLQRTLDEVLDRRALLVGHVVAYDAACVLSTFPSVWGKIWQAYEINGIVCTGIRERLIDIANGEFGGRWNHSGKWEDFKYTLADISRRRLGQAMSKGEDTWRKRYAELDGLPLSDWPREAVDYSILDAQMTWAVFSDQETRAKRIGYRLPTQYEDSRADFTLRLTSAWGIETDPDHVLKIWNQTVSRMVALVPALEAQGLATWKKKPTVQPADGRPLTLPEVKKSLSVLRAIIAKHYPGGKPPLTPKGSIQTGKDVLREIDFEPLKRLSEFNGLQKTASTYLSKFFAPVVHASYLAVGAASDRTSSFGPNVQNLPRLPGVRECFVSRPGTVFLACDYEAQEMRTLAQSCLDIVGHSILANRFRENPHFDPHLEFAARLAKITTDEAERLKAAGDPGIKKLRQQSKAANFGYPGGMGSTKFIQYAKGYGIDLTADESQGLRDGFFATWPEMTDYFRHIQNVVGSAGIGQQTIPQSGFRRGNCGYSDTANGYFQSLAAHSSKSALFAVCQKAFCNRQSALYGSRPVLFIHDEIILETPDEIGDEAARELEQVMVRTMQRWIPDVPAAASATLMHRWSKSAEQVFDGDKLVPWEDEEDLMGDFE